MSDWVGAIMGIPNLIAGGLTGYLANQENMQNQVNMLEHQQKFIEKENQIMRNREDNAITRQTYDMARAGINPMLGGMQGGAQAQLGGMVGLGQIPDVSASLNSMADSVANATTAAIQGTSLAKEIRKTEVDIDKIFSDIGVNDQTIEKMKEEIRKMEYDEALTWQKLFTEIENTQNVAKDTLLKIAQKELTETETRLTGNQITDLKNKFEDRDWYNLYKRFEDAVADVRTSDLTAQQRRNAELQMYKIINETEKLDHDMIIDRLKLELEKLGMDRKVISDIVGAMTKGLVEGATGR